MTSDFPPVRRREIFGWCCFDFANSAFTTVIITVVYAVYFNTVVAGGAPGAETRWGMALGFSQLIVIILAPWLGAVGDFTGRKKEFLMVTAVICSVGTALLFFPNRGEVGMALALVMVANIAFSLSENLCASFLPEISTPETVGRVSGYGWSFGYLGGLLSLGLALAILQSGAGVQWTLPMTGAFFFLGCLPTMVLLRERTWPKVRPAGETYFGLGWRQVGRTLKEVTEFRTLAWFFVAFTLFMAGLSAVIAFAALFAARELALTQMENIALFALLQVSSAVGAFGFGYFQDRFGAKRTLTIALCLWLAVSVWAAFCGSKEEFFAIGVVAGLGIGSLQSASRAVVAGLTPEGRSGEFFGFWGVFGKFGGVIGPVLMGLMASSFGYRIAILINGLFFLSGLIVLAPLALGRPQVTNCQRLA